VPAIRVSRSDPRESSRAAAAAAPNTANDKTGGINRLFTRIYRIRERGKALKKRNRTRYYLEKWAVVAALLLVFIYI